MTREYGLLVGACGGWVLVSDGEPEEEEEPAADDVGEGEDDEDADGDDAGDEVVDDEGDDGDDDELPPLSLF